MTIASGRCDSEPIPWLIAAGNRPIAAIAAVIITGRIRDRTPSLVASCKGEPSFRFALISEIIITPFCMQIPNKAIKPIPADIEKLKPVIRRAAIPPTAANGTFSNTSPASLALEKRINRIMKNTPRP